jgi:hypothetical protein
MLRVRNYLSAVLVVVEVVLAVVYRHWAKGERDMSDLMMAVTGTRIKKEMESRKK